MIVSNRNRTKVFEVVWVIVDGAIDDHLRVGVVTVGGNVCFPPRFPLDVFSPVD